ncbi:hypothetical protein F2Q69_00007622 [Brassica cretica]|uniref:Uncharacterized protein n=1 Tax=Brassica cretica TaxID=69181 RepID=A0A8S9P6U7_BRACR|nr:hypothetical protein F2Q69_00007622 [Brassica cretica]
MGFIGISVTFFLPLMNVNVIVRKPSVYRGHDNWYTREELGTMVAVEDFRRNKLREGRRPDAGDDVEQNRGLEEMEQTIDGNHDLLLGINY